MSCRLGVANYTLLLALAFIAWSVFTVFACEVLGESERIDAQALNALVGMLGVILGAVVYGLSARRLMDLGMSPRLTKVLAFPPFALVLIPYLCLVPGSQANNRHGVAPLEAGFGRAIGAIALLLIAIQFSFGALATYYKARHVPGREDITLPWAPEAHS